MEEKNVDIISYAIVVSASFVTLATARHPSPLDRVAEKRKSSRRGHALAISMQIKGRKTIEASRVKKRKEKSVREREMKGRAYSVKATY